MEEAKQRKDDASVAELLSMMRSLMGDFNGHAVKLLEVEHKIDLILGAFPAGGLVEHRLFHEREIADSKDARDLKNSLIKSLTTWGVLGTLAAVGAALVLYLQVKLGGK